MSNLAKAALGIATLVTVVLAIAAVVSAASTGTSSATSSPGTGPPGGSGPRATAVAAKVADFAFVPEPLTVTAGGTVTWTNDDPFAHTVKARDGSFASGNLARGTDYAHTFSKPGSYPYLCGIHNSMTGTVVVLP